MSLITQCPACTTLFKVVADQLKISQGWVRCGQCKEVFDANAHLTHSLPVQEQVDFGSKSESIADEPALQATHSAIEAEMLSGAHSDNYASEAIDKLEAPDSISVDPEVDSEPVGGGVTKRAFGSSPEFASSDWVNSVHPPSPETTTEASNSLEIDALDAELGYGKTPQAPQADDLYALTEPAPTPTFVRQAQQAQRWRSPWMRAGLCAVAFFLCIAGILQIVLYERDRIVAMHPRMHSSLTDLCRTVGCTIGPLKNIENIVVDASSFNKIRGDSKNELYKITLNLKNNGPLPVALPHIELSLNDTQDQTIVRRVLNPADVGALQFVLSARGEFNGSATVQIDTAQLGGSRVAGYRIWAFYPS
jgi:predicted Zn finger-like uncharacterized protein